MVSNTVKFGKGHKGKGNQAENQNSKGKQRCRWRSRHMDGKNTLYYPICNILAILLILHYPMGAELQSNKKPKIHFVLQKQVEFGKALYVVGNVQQLGSWKVQQALRLSWNKNHYWTGFVQLPSARLEQPIEFKYVIAEWEKPELDKIQWEAGQTNRLIEGPIRSPHVICENTWNMEKITLNLAVSDDCRNEEYYVTGDCKQLGNWKKSIKMRPSKNESLHQISNLTPLEEGKKNIIYSLSFQIFRAKTKIRYSYIRKKAGEYEIERNPGRKYELSTQTNVHPKCLKISHTNGDTAMLQVCNFQELNFSKVTKNILLGPYLKTPEDFKVLKAEGVSCILSIQTSEDIAQHRLTEIYLEEQAERNGMTIHQYAIQDMNKKDFLSKYMGAIKLLKKLIDSGQKVYVHCSAGIYRSPQLVVLFLIITEKLNPQEAIEYIKSRHPFARPNHRVVSQALILLSQAGN